MSSSRRWFSPLGALLGLLLLYGLIFLAKANGQENSQPSLQSIRLKLETSLDASEKLRQALIVQRQTRADLEQAYASLKEQLQTSSAALLSQIEALQTQLDASTGYSASLEAEMVTLTASLSESRKASEGLSTAFESYKAQANSELFWWKVGAGGAGLLALILGIVAALK